MKSAFEVALKRLGPTLASGHRAKEWCTVCDGTVYILADSQGQMVAGVGIRDAKYPERVALMLLKEVLDKTAACQSAELLDNAGAGDLNRPLKKILKDVMKNFDDPGKH